MRRGVVTVAGMLALWSADAAHAACAQQTARQRAELAGVILTGIVEAGPVTPARVRVEAWEKGGGPAVVEVDTGVHEDYVLGEGVFPQPGERWRIFGDVFAGRIHTGACDGSRRLDAAPGAPLLRFRSVLRALGPATFGGRPLRGSLPRLTVAPGVPLRLSARVADVRLLGAARGVRVVRRARTLVVRAPRRARRLGRLVADTGAGFFAVRLRRAVS